LLLVSDLPGISVQGGLSEGATGQAGRDVLVVANSQSVANGEVMMDNAGSRSTGMQRALATLSLNSPLGIGDQIGLSAMKSEGSTYLRGEISWPVGYDGWRVSLYEAYLKYRVVLPELQSIQASGTSNTFGVGASYPIWRTPLHNLSTHVQAERKGFDNQASGATESQYTSHLLKAGLYGNYSDAWRGFNSASLVWTSGWLDLDGSPNQSRDAAGARTAGHFNKLNYSWSRLQPVSPRITAVATLSGQWASKNLDSSEKFGLGGHAGVRAYPSSEALGALGQLVNLEMRWRASETDTLAAFYDWGHIQLLRDSVSSATQNDHDIRGAGLAWMVQLPANASLRVSWATRLGRNPNPTTAGTDQDGTLVRHRFWLTASVPFAF
jgi:hemolysin activation/secretion protein